MTEARVPTRATLRKYGLTVEDWQEILDRQGGACDVCQKVPASGTLHIDHQHVRGWKTMPAEVRRTYVRGLVCWFENTNLLRVGATPERLRRAADYLERYDSSRRASA